MKEKLRALVRKIDRIEEDIYMPFKSSPFNDHEEKVVAWMRTKEGLNDLNEITTQAAVISNISLTSKRQTTTRKILRYLREMMAL